MIGCTDMINPEDPECVMLICARALHRILREPAVVKWASEGLE